MFGNPRSPPCFLKFIFCLFQFYPILQGNFNQFFKIHPRFIKLNRRGYFYRTLQRKRKNQLEPIFGISERFFCRTQAILNIFKPYFSAIHIQRRCKPDFFPDFCNFGILIFAILECPSNCFVKDSKSRTSSL